MPPFFAVFLFAALSSLSVVHCQWSTAASTHIISILPIESAQEVSLTVTTTELQTVHFHIRNISAAIIANGSVSPGTPTKILLSGYYSVGSPSERNKGLVVTTGSSEDISITVALFDAYSASTYQSYPPWTYDSYKYYAISTSNSFASGGHSFLLIVSTSNGTTVTITPSVDIVIPSDLSFNGSTFTLTAGNTVNISLDYLETFLIKPAGSDSTNDLTGSKVESNQPIIVYSGHTCGNIQNELPCDFIGEQVPPVASWGDTFLVSTFFSRETDFVLKLVAAQNSTHVDLSCYENFIDTQYYTFSLQEGSNVMQVVSGQKSCYLTSDRPILIAQFSQSSNAILSMVIIPPTLHYTINVTFPVINILSSAVFMNLAVISDNFVPSQIKLNGVSLGSQTWTTISNSMVGGYMLTGYRLNGNEISVWSNDPYAKLFPMIYGLGVHTGYAYTGGMKLRPHSGNYVQVNVTADMNVIITLKGDNVLFTCNVNASQEYHIYWQFNNITIDSDDIHYISTNVNGSEVLTISNVQINDTGAYTCIAISGFQSSSARIELYVQEPATFERSPLMNITAILGGNLILNCSVSGVPLPNVVWIKNNEIYVNSHLIPNANISTTYINDHLVLSELTLYNISLSDSGEYKCHASNEHRSVNSSSSYVNILTPPLLVSSPQSSVFNQSDTLQLTCVFSGKPVPHVMWFYESDVLYNTTNITISSNSNETTVVSTLTITDIQKIEEGNYTCKGINNVPNHVRYIEQHRELITVQVPPTIDPISESLIAIFNESITIQFEVTNAFPPVRSKNIHWSHPINFIEPNYFGSGSGSHILMPNRFMFSDDLLSLTIFNVQTSDKGTYKIFVTNEAGTREATTTLDVYVKVAVLLNFESRIERNEGEDIAINCTADGIPQPQIVWRRNGQLIVNSPRLNISSSGGSSGFRSSSIPGVISTTSVLTITDLRGTDNGSYSCRADNEANEVAISTFTLEVIEPPPINYCAGSPCQNNGNCTSVNGGYICQCVETFTGKNCNEQVIIKLPPEIIQFPQNTSAKLYSTTKLTCRAAGSPIPTILWYKDDELITNNNIDPSVLIFSELNLNDRGFYRCQAKNTIDQVLQFVNSPEVVVNITNIIQYEAVIQLPLQFYDEKSTPGDKISEIILESNNYLAGSDVANVSNTYIFSVQILNSDSINYTAQPNSLPIVITLVTEREADEQLRLGVTEQLSLLNQQLTVNFTIAEVDRFDGCHVDYTIIPSHSGRPDLNLTIKWPETNIGGVAVVNCPCGNGRSEGQLQARRYCGGDFTNGGIWSTADVVHCNFSDLAREICNLANLPIAEKVEQLQDLTRNTSKLGATEVAASVTVLTTATEDVSGNLTLTSTFLEIVDNILVVDTATLQESQETSNTSAKVLEAIESVVENIPIANVSEPVVLVQKSFAVSAKVVNPEKAQSFGVNIRNNQSLTSDDLTFGGLPNSQPTASINLPNNLFNSMSNNTRITNAVFTSDSLFLRRDTRYTEVGSVIISATVVGVDTIRNLNPPVTLGFQISPDSSNLSSQCTFWNQTLDSGYGDWSNEGCNTSGNGTSVSCECNHLTSFAILLDVSPVETTTEQTAFTVFLDSVSYIGIIISLVCLIITVISYLSNKKLRSSDHGQLLLNLCFALMGLYITFIIALHSRAVEILCAIVGVVLQYFFLVTFMTMAAEAINLYMNLVIVLGKKISHYVLKAVIICWVLPIFVVIFCFTPDYNNYSREYFCRAFGIPFYIGTVAPFVLIYIFNWIIFAIIIISLIRRQCSSKLNSKDARLSSFFKQQFFIALTLAFLFGLGWGIGLLSTEGIYNNRIARDVFASIFVVATAFHGLFIFLMHAVRSKEVRDIWKRWLFCIICKDYKVMNTSSTFTRTTSATVKSTQKKSDAFSSNEVTLKSFTSKEDDGMDVEKSVAESESLDEAVVKENVETSFIKQETINEKSDEFSSNEVTSKSKEGETVNDDVGKAVEGSELLDEVVVKESMETKPETVNEESEAFSSSEVTSESKEDVTVKDDVEKGVEGSEEVVVKESMETKPETVNEKESEAFSSSEVTSESKEDGTVKDDVEKDVEGSELLDEVVVKESMETKPETVNEKESEAFSSSEVTSESKEDGTVKDDVEKDVEGSELLDEVVVKESMETKPETVNEKESEAFSSSEVTSESKEDGTVKDDVEKDVEGSELLDEVVVKESIETKPETVNDEASHDDDTPEKGIKPSVDKEHESHEVLQSQDKISVAKTEIETHVDQESDEDEIETFPV